MWSLTHIFSPPGLWSESSSTPVVPKQRKLWSSRFCWTQTPVILTHWPCWVQLMGPGDQHLQSHSFSKPVQFATTTFLPLWTAHAGGPNLLQNSNGRKCPLYAMLLIQLRENHELLRKEISYTKMKECWQKQNALGKAADARNIRSFEKKEDHPQRGNTKVLPLKCICAQSEHLHK